MFIPIKDYNPTLKTAYVTIILIVINCSVFLYQALLSGKGLDYHIADSGLVPYEITHMTNIPVPVGQDEYGRLLGVERNIPPYLSLITSMFMHASLFHLLGNMLFLWIFGNNIEDRLGTWKFILFYLITGIGAALIHVLFNFNSNQLVIGASGAVSGVMGAYLILYPRAKVRTLMFLFIFVTFVDLPASVFLIVWFVFQLLYAGSQTSIAWLAHVGGFILGILFIKLLNDKHKPVVEWIE